VCLHLLPVRPWHLPACTSGPTSAPGPPQALLLHLIEPELLQFSAQLIEELSIGVALLLHGPAVVSEPLLGVRVFVGEGVEAGLGVLETGLEVGVLLQG
jgi:hypothetical protein